MGNLFQSSVLELNNRLSSEATATAVVLPLPPNPMSLKKLGLSTPAQPRLRTTVATHMHHYKGRFCELPKTFVVEGSPFGDHWLSETTATVETEAVKALTVLKTLHPAGTLLFIGGLCQLLLFWFVL
jgi:hypothetical protein